MCTQLCSAFLLRVYEQLHSAIMLAGGFVSDTGMLLRLKGCALWALGTVEREETGRVLVTSKPEPSLAWQDAMFYPWHLAYVQ